MNAIILARASGLTYLHSPFSLVRHADRPQQEWADAWEKLMNLGVSERACDVQRNEVVNYCYGFESLPMIFGWDNRNDELTRRFKETVPEFRNKYYLDKSPRINREVTVAVHVRRGDVSADNTIYFTDIDTIARTVTRLKALLETHGVTYNIAVYSQGDPAEFSELSSLGAELFIDADAIWTMQEMIEADVLVMAKGFYSYYAGLISDGIKLFNPSEGTDPLDDWLILSPDGSFDSTAFERQLLSLVKSKEISHQQPATEQ